VWCVHQHIIIAKEVQFSTLHFVGEVSCKLQLRRGFILKKIRKKKSNRERFIPFIPLKNYHKAKHENEKIHEEDLCQLVKSLLLNDTSPSKHILNKSYIEGK
jgi:hypothetical protein